MMIIILIRCAVEFVAPGGGSRFFRRLRLVRGLAGSFTETFFCPLPTRGRPARPSAVPAGARKHRTLDSRHVTQYLLLFIVVFNQRRT